MNNYNKFSLRNLIARKSGNTNSSNESIFNISQGDLQNDRISLQDHDLEPRFLRDRDQHDQDSSYRRQDGDSSSNISSLGSRALGSITAHSSTNSMTSMLRNKMNAAKNKNSTGDDAEGIVPEIIQRDISTKTGISEITSDMHSVDDAGFSIDGDAIKNDSGRNLRNTGEDHDQAQSILEVDATKLETINSSSQHSGRSFTSSQTSYVGNSNSNSTNRSVPNLHPQRPSKFKQPPPAPLDSREKRWEQFDTGDELEAESREASASAFAKATAVYAERLAVLETSNSPPKESMSLDGRSLSTSHRSLKSERSLDSAPGDLDRSWSSHQRRTSAGTTVSSAVTRRQSINHAHGKSRSGSVQSQTSYQRGYRSMSLDLQSEEFLLKTGPQRNKQNEEDGLDVAPDADGAYNIIYDFERSKVLLAKLEEMSLETSNVHSVNSSSRSSLQFRYRDNATSKGFPQVHMEEANQSSNDGDRRGSFVTTSTTRDLMEKDRQMSELTIFDGNHPENIAVDENNSLTGIGDSVDDDQIRPMSKILSSKSLNDGMEASLEPQSAMDPEHSKGEPTSLHSDIDDANRKRSSSDSHSESDDHEDFKSDSEDSQSTDMKHTMNLLLKSRQMRKQNISFMESREDDIESGKSQISPGDESDMSLNSNSEQSSLKGKLPTRGGIQKSMEESGLLSSFRSVGVSASDLHSDMSAYNAFADPDSDDECGIILPSDDNYADEGNQSEDFDSSDDSDVDPYEALEMSDENEVVSSLHNAQKQENLTETGMITTFSYQNLAEDFFSNEEDISGDLKKDKKPEVPDPISVSRNNNSSEDEHNEDMKTDDSLMSITKAGKREEDEATKNETLESKDSNPARIATIVKQVHSDSESFASLQLCEDEESGNNSISSNEVERFDTDDFSVEGYEENLPILHQSNTDWSINLSQPIDSSKKEGKSKLINKVSSPQSDDGGSPITDVSPSVGLTPYYYRDSMENLNRLDESKTAHNSEATDYSSHNETMGIERGTTSESNVDAISRCTLERNDPNRNSILSRISEESMSKSECGHSSLEPYSMKRAFDRETSSTALIPQGKSNVSSSEVFPLTKNLPVKEYKYEPTQKDEGHNFLRGTNEEYKEKSGVGDVASISIDPQDNSTLSCKEEKLIGSETLSDDASHSSIKQMLSEAADDDDDDDGSFMPWPSNQGKHAFLENSPKNSIHVSNTNRESNDSRTHEVGGNDSIERSKNAGGSSFRIFKPASDKVISEYTTKLAAFGDIEEEWESANNDNDLNRMGYREVSDDAVDMSSTQSASMPQASGSSNALEDADAMSSTQSASIPDASGRSNVLDDGDAMSPAQSTFTLEASRRSNVLDDGDEMSPRQSASILEASGNNNSHPNPDGNNIEEGEFNGSVNEISTASIDDSVSISSGEKSELLTNNISEQNNDESSQTNSSQTLDDDKEEFLPMITKKDFAKDNDHTFSCTENNAYVGENSKNSLACWLPTNSQTPDGEKDEFSPMVADEDIKEDKSSYSKDESEDGKSEDSFLSLPPLFSVSEESTRSKGPGEKRAVVLKDIISHPSVDATRYRENSIIIEEKETENTDTGRSTAKSEIEETGNRSNTSLSSPSESKPVARDHLFQDSRNSLFKQKQSNDLAVEADEDATKDNDEQKETLSNNVFEDNCSDSHTNLKSFRSFLQDFDSDSCSESVEEDKLSLPSEKEVINGNITMTLGESVSESDDESILTSPLPPMNVKSSDSLNIPEADKLSVSSDKPTHSLLTANNSNLGSTIVDISTGNLSRNSSDSDSKFVPSDETSSSMQQSKQLLKSNINSNFDLLDLKQQNEMPSHQNLSSKSSNSNGAIKKSSNRIKEETRIDPFEQKDSRGENSPLFGSEADRNIEKKEDIETGLGLSAKTEVAPLVVTSPGSISIQKSNSSNLHRRNHPRANLCTKCITVMVVMTTIAALTISLVVLFDQETSPPLIITSEALIPESPVSPDSDELFENKVWLEQASAAPEIYLNDSSGNAIAISDDGTRLVVGGKRFSRDSETQVGIVRIYKLVEGTQKGSQAWKELTSIEGERSGDQFGFALSLSANGDYLAIGAPGYDKVSGEDSNEGKVYLYNISGNNDNILESSEPSFLGQDEDDMFGSAVSLDGTGDNLAIGAPKRNNAQGSVFVYTKDPRSNWYQMGDVLDGTNKSQFGTSVSLALSGLHLVVGAQGDNKGYVKVFKNSINGAWSEEQLLESGEDSDKYGYSISQTPDAKMLAVGAPYGSSEAGTVYLYSKVNSTSAFQQIDESISGFGPEDHLGMSVSLALDGGRVGVGVPGRGIDQGERFGSVIVYKVEKNDGTETLILPSKEIYGDEGQNFGSSVALTSNGTVVAVGIPSAGIVRTYK